MFTHNRPPVSALLARFGSRSTPTPLVAHDPSATLASLSRAARQGQPSLESELVRLLRQPYSPSIVAATSRAFRALQRKPHKSLIDRRLQGACGFYLFVYHADHSGTRHSDVSTPTSARDYSTIAPSAPKLGRAHEFLTDPETVKFLYALYKIREPILGTPETMIRDGLELYAIGITSLIIRIRRFVLKLVHPRYFHLERIALTTREYMNSYGKIQTDHIPALYGCGSRYILMQFVPGDTFWEYVRRKHVHLRGADTELLAGIMCEICLILRECAEQGIYHGDLSAYNVIISDRILDGKEVPFVYVIDFGPNYLLSEHVGTRDASLRAMVYVAPEALNPYDPPEPSPNGDLYSVGVLLVEGLLGSTFKYAALPDSVDEVYRLYPGLGALVDDLVDRREETRAAELIAPDERRKSSAVEYLAGLGSAKKLPSIYDRLRYRIAGELEVVAKAAESARNPVWGIISLIAVCVNGWRDVVMLWNLRRVAGARLEANDARLVWWSLLASGLNGAVLWMVLVPGIAQGPSNWWSSATAADIHVLAASIAGVSFAILASKYYVSIFGYVSASGVARFSDMIMRFNSFFFIVPIVLGIYRWPQIWPAWAAIGLLPAAINNLTCHFLCHGAQRRMDAVSSTDAGASWRPSVGFASADMMHARTQFGFWGVATTAYVGVLFAMTGLMLLDLLHDQLIDVLVISLVVNGLIYVINCSKDAPMMRTGLARYIRALWRVRVADELRTGQETGRTSPRLRKNDAPLKRANELGEE